MFSISLLQARNIQNKHKNHFHCKLWNEIEEQKVNNLMKEVAEIQKSVGWQNTHFNLAKHSFTDPKVFKILAKDKDTHELAGYALMSPKSDNFWLITQIVVMKQLQKMKIGTNILNEIFSEAPKHKITAIRIVANDTMITFFNKFPRSDYDCKSTPLLKSIKMLTYIQKPINENLMSEFVKMLNAHYKDNEKDYTEIYRLMPTFFPDYKYIRPQDFETLYSGIKDRTNNQKVLKIICEHILENTDRTKVLIDFIANTKNQTLKFIFTKTVISSKLLKNIKDLKIFEIENDDKRLEIAIIYLNICEYKSQFFSEFKEFGIKKQGDIYNIAKIVARSYPYATGRHLEELGIKDENIFCEIVNESLSCHLQMKGFKALKTANIIKTYEEIARFDGEACAIWIKYFRLRDQKALIHIARLALENHVYWVSYYFDRFGIEDEDERIELFKFATSLHIGVYECIASFRIQTEEKRIALAKWLIQQGCSISSKIQEFQISNEMVKMEIALHEAAIHPKDLCESIKNFQLSNEADRIVLAHTALENLEGILDFGLLINNFEISSESARILLAKRAAEKGLLKVNNCVENYGISDDEALYQTAVKAANSSPVTTAETFYKYRTMDEKKRIVIAKIIACLNGKAISQHIHEFCIQNQVALEEIALLSAANDGKGTSEYFKNYGLTKEEARINVALSIGVDMIEFINQFEISNIDAINKITYLAASVPHFTLSEILNWIKWIKFPVEMKYEIGKFCARTKSYDTAYNIFLFKDNSPKEILEIMLTCIRHSSMSIESLQYSNDMHPVVNILRQINNRQNFAQVCAVLTDFCRQHIDNFDVTELLQIFKVGQEDSIKIKLANWVVFTVASCLHYELSRQEISRLVKGPFINAIVEFPDEQMRFKLIDLAVRLTKSGGDKELAINLSPDGTKHILLPWLVIYSLNLKNDDPFLFKTILTHLQHKDYLDPLKYKIIVQGLYQLMCDYDFTKAEYLRFLRDIFLKLNPSESVEKIKSIEGMIAFDQEPKLTDKFDDLKNIERGIITINEKKIFYFKEYVPNRLIEKLMNDEEATINGLKEIIYGLTFGFHKNFPPFNARQNDWKNIITRLYPKISNAPESFFHHYINKSFIKVIENFPSTLQMAFGPPDVFLKIEGKLLPAHKKVLTCYGELAGNNYLSRAVSGTFKSETNVIDLDYTGELPYHENVLEPIVEVLVPPTELTYRGIALVLLRIYGYEYVEFMRTFHEEILQANNYLYPGIDNLKLSSVTQDRLYLRTLYDLRLEQLINTMIAKVHIKPNYAEIAEVLADFYFNYPLANQEESFCQLEHMCGQVFEGFKKTQIRLLGDVQNLMGLVQQKFISKSGALTIAPKTYAKNDIEALLHYCGEHLNEIDRHEFYQILLRSEVFELGEQGRKKFRSSAFNALKKQLSEKELSYKKFEDLLISVIYFLSWAQFKSGSLTTEEYKTIEKFVIYSSQKLPILMLVGDENFRLKKSIMENWTKLNRVLGTNIPFVIDFE